MHKSAQGKDGCWASFVSTKGLPKSSRAVLIVAGTTHTTLVELTECIFY
jgi:hypothetical protein